MASVGLAKWIIWLAPFCKQGCQKMRNIPIYISLENNYLHFFKQIKINVSFHFINTFYKKRTDIHFTDKFSSYSTVYGHLYLTQPKGRIKLKIDIKVTYQSTAWMSIHLFMQNMSAAVNNIARYQCDSNLQYIQS